MALALGFVATLSYEWDRWESNVVLFRARHHECGRIWKVSKSGDARMLGYRARLVGWLVGWSFGWLVEKIERCVDRCGVDV